MTTTPAAPAANAPAPARSGRKFNFQDYALVAVIAILIIVGGILEGSSFVSKDNFFNVLRQGSIVGVLAIGMTFVIATAGIDLSVGSMVAACGVAGGLLVDSGDLMFIVAALAFGIALGAINGAAISYGKVVPFIATLAMLLIARGLALWMSDKTPISLFSLDSVRWFGTGEILTIPSSLVVFLVVAAIGWVLLNRTPYGRYVVAVGGNPEAARIAGVKVQRILFSVYVLSGLCAGIAAVLLCGRLASASPVSGNLYELDAIAAVVIGGTSLAGGRATIVGTVLGVITFALVFNLLTLMNLAVEIQQVTKGGIILAAVLLQRRSS
ncbi:ABC transporter permease [Solirubrobacter ginsenosidimutans]|uniref:ABC transporter permease n=1 Tax=Solirubrobacter ginsenosidimutans TaxID=490573 RepID=A0A9X3MR79_9ACTN|nr:ABC transporter permease [Solirubrobacter ginsenosidimutans]MDA0161064.1 ABC transporter permease [Solirubrobacter ginsenosidimutans]